MQRVVDKCSREELCPVFSIRLAPEAMNRAFFQLSVRSLPPPNYEGDSSFSEVWMSRVVSSLGAYSPPRQKKRTSRNHVGKPDSFSACRRRPLRPRGRRPREGERRRAEREVGAPSAVRAKEGESAAAATKGTVSGDALFEATFSA